MWIYARPFVATCLALILAVTSLTMAVARGQTRVAGEIVICTGYGMSTVKVDANGEPADPIHICPDMALGFMAALEVVSPTPTRPEGASNAAFDAASLRLTAYSTFPSRARDPPSFT
jgi:hypothetical protein